jgi:hypothetical protein
MHNLGDADQTPGVQILIAGEGMKTSHSKVGCAFPISGGD